MRTGAPTPVWLYYTVVVKVETGLVQTRHVIYDSTRHIPLCYDRIILLFMYFFIAMAFSNKNTIIIVNYDFLI